MAMFYWCLYEGWLNLIFRISIDPISVKIPGSTIKKTLKTKARLIRKLSPNVQLNFVWHAVSRNTLTSAAHSLLEGKRRYWFWQIHHVAVLVLAWTSSFKNHQDVGKAFISLYLWLVNTEILFIDLTYSHNHFIKKVVEDWCFLFPVRTDYNSFMMSTAVLPILCSHWNPTVSVAYI